MEKTSRFIFVTFMLVVFAYKSVGQQDGNQLFPSPAQNGDNDQNLGADSSTTTTASPAFRNCVDNCLTIQNYNPVCGTDGVTYNNQFRLECARRCGAQVQMVRGGACTAL